jgi:hypothetical protein
MMNDEFAQNIKRSEISIHSGLRDLIYFSNKKSAKFSNSALFLCLSIYIYSATILTVSVKTGMNGLSSYGRGPINFSKSDFNKTSFSNKC